MAGLTVNGIILQSADQLSDNNLVQIFGDGPYHVMAPLSVLAEFLQAEEATQSAQFVYNTNSATTAETLTAEDIIGGTVEVILAMTGALGAAEALTLPTVESLLTALGELGAPGYSYKLRVINVDGTQTWTVTTNTGWTLSGTDTIASATWRDFIVTITGADTATLQAIGSGTA